MTARRQDLRGRGRYRGAAAIGIRAVARVGQRDGGGDIKQAVGGSQTVLQGKQAGAGRNFAPRIFIRVRKVRPELGRVQVDIAGNLGNAVRIRRYGESRRRRIETGVSEITIVRNAVGRININQVCTVGRQHIILKLADILHARGGHNQLAAVHLPDQLRA